LCINLLTTISVSPRNFIYLYRVNNNVVFLAFAMVSVCVLFLCKITMGKYIFYMVLEMVVLYLFQMRFISKTKYNNKSMHQNTIMRIICSPLQNFIWRRKIYLYKSEMSISFSSLIDLVIKLRCLFICFFLDFKEVCKNHIIFRLSLKSGINLKLYGEV